MTHDFWLSPGLPPYGTSAVPFPAEWGRLGREGTVVGLRSPNGHEWSANFQRGIEGETSVYPHPDGQRVLVLSRGDVWCLDPDARSAEQIAAAVHAVWPVEEPTGFVLNRQGMAFIRLDARGLRWHTRRLSWDGFESVVLDGKRIRGKAWNALEDRMQEFEVDLATGRSLGGGFDLTDTEGWERLASSASAI